MLTCKEEQSFLSGLDHHETSAPPPHNSLLSFLALHVQDVFLINGRRMDGLTEGPDNNGWSTGHKCSYWGDLWASAHRRLSSNRWDDFSKPETDGSERGGKALSLVPAHYLLIRCFGWKPLQGVHPGNNTLAVNMTKTGENKCERESETVKANQGQGRVALCMQDPPPTWLTGGNLDGIHVICKSHFEEAITFNNLDGRWCFDSNFTKISRYVKRSN